MTKKIFLQKTPVCEFIWLPWQRPLGDCQAYVRIIIITHMPTKPVKLVKTGPVYSEIVDVIC